MPSDPVTRGRWRLHAWGCPVETLSSPPLWGQIEPASDGGWTWEAGGWGRSASGAASSRYAAQRAVRRAWRRGVADAE